MKPNYNRHFFIILFISSILISCNSEEIFDKAPDNVYHYSLTYNPEYLGSLNLNIDSTSSGLYIYNSFGLNTNPYNISTNIDRKYRNNLSQSLSEINYVFNFHMEINSKLAANTYLFTAANGDNLASSFITTDAYGNQYGWYGYSNNVHPFDQYPNSYTNIKITKIYTRKLVDGYESDGKKKSAIHTYADGSIDATFLGNYITLLSGNKLPSYSSQLHFQCTFTGAEIYNP